MRYASLNAHRGFEQSRRDDLEAIGHMLMYFLRSSLPCSGLEARTKKEKYQKIKEKKESTPLPELLGASVAEMCGSFCEFLRCQGHPKAFEKYLEYARNLGFKAHGASPFKACCQDRPNYVMLRGLFSELRVGLVQELHGAFEDEIQKEEGKPIQECSLKIPKGIFSRK